MAAPPTYDQATIKTACSQKWGTEYDMVKYCMDQRRAGYDTYIALLHRGGDQLVPTFERCQVKWGAEWDMVAYCAKQQVNAITGLQGNVTGLPKNVGEEIMTRCMGKWGLEWDMVAYCAKQQAEGWRSINN